MKLQQAMDMILSELESVEHPGKTKEQILIWRLGFVIGVLADELRSDWILESNLKARIKLYKQKQSK